MVGNALIPRNPSLINSRRPRPPTRLDLRQPRQARSRRFQEPGASMRSQPRFVAVHDGLDQQPHPGVLAGAVGAMGNCEGVHRGHRAVIAAAVARALALGRPAAALTFEPHPRALFNPGEALVRLTDEAAKLRLFAATALGGAVVMKF